MSICLSASQGSNQKARRVVHPEPKSLISEPESTDNYLPDRLCISTAGARPDPAWLAPLMAPGRRLFCGYDADPTGDSVAQAMIAIHPAVQRLRPSQHDWNDVLQLSG